MWISARSGVRSSLIPGQALMRKIVANLARLNRTNR